MTVSSVKRKILEAVQNFPDDVTFEDAIEHLVFLAKIDRGLTQADAGETIPHAEA
jgi:hypothetical protein